MRPLMVIDYGELWTYRYRIFRDDTPVGHTKRKKDADLFAAVPELLLVVRAFKAHLENLDEQDLPAYRLCCAVIAQAEAGHELAHRRGDRNCHRLIEVSQAVAKITRQLVMHRWET